MNLKIQDAEIKGQIWDRDLSEFIDHHYRLPSWGVLGFDVVAEFALNNDTYYVYTAKKGELSEWEKADLQKFIERGTGFYSLSVVLKDMANKGLIEEGKYLLRVSW